MKKKKKREKRKRDIAEGGRRIIKEGKWKKWVMN